MADNNKFITIMTVSGGNYQPVTTGSFDLRVTPFTTAGISGTHIANGVWKFAAFSSEVTYKLYNTTTDTEITTFAGGGSDTQALYDSNLGNYIHKDGTVVFTANQPMGGFKVTGSGAATANGDLTRWEQTGVIDQARTISGSWTFTTIPISTVTPTLPNHVVNKTFSERFLLTNVIWVHADTTAVTGRLYNSVSDAMTYIQSLGTRSSSNRFEVWVYPCKAGKYIDNFIWYDFINIIGVGEVVLENTATFALFARSGTSDTPKASNIIFTQGDQNLDFHKVNCEGGAFVSLSGLVDWGRLQFGTSQFKNFGFFYDYPDGYIVNDGSNKILSGCYGNAPIAWDSSDNVMDYKYITGLTLTY
jgi:hypothetical protein